MKWKIKKEEWKIKFAFLPVQIGDEVIWLEKYKSKDYGGLAEIVDFI